MIKKTSMVLAFVLLVITTVTQASTKNESIGETLTLELKDTFEPKITQLYKDYHLQGDLLVAVVGEKGLMYSERFNKKSINDEKTLLNNDTPFFIASHTKAMTGTLIKILEEEGKVKLDKSLYFYLPELFSNTKVDAQSITVRQLLNHTAGFTSIMHTFKTAFLGAEGGEDELIKALNHKVLTAPAGNFRYSNTGPIIAGMIVEKVTGNTWQEEMQKRIFAPLLMNNTSSKVSDYPENSILPSIETTAENTVFRSGFYKQDSTMHAAGGTISTINDLAKWLQFNINQDTSIIKNKASFIELHQATTTQKKTYFTYERIGYSLGWDIATYHGETILTRFGGYGGISFHASFMPSKKMGVIAFFNEERAYKLPHLAANYLYNIALENSLADQIFEEEKLSFKKGYDSQNEEALTKDMYLGFSGENDELVGTYKSDNDWPEITVTKLDDMYSVKWGVLSGPLLRSTHNEEEFSASLGPLIRNFKIYKEEGITKLKNGSLLFIKK